MVPSDTNLASEGLEDDPFGEAIDRAETIQRDYAKQLGLQSERIPFTAETVPDASIAVRVNNELLEEVATHILNRAGHVSIIDERGAGKSHFRDLVYRSLSSGPRSDALRIVRIREVESITTRRFYTRLLDGLQRYDDLADVIPEQYPHPTDEVRALVEEVGSVLERDEKACIVQVDQMEDAARNTRTFRQLLAGLQSIGDLGETEPVFICFLFGTPEVSDRITRLRETFASRLVAADRRLARFDVAETAELVARWLAWARDESYNEGYATDPYAGGALSAITDRSDGTPRRVRQECYHAFRAGARQYDDSAQVEITRETLEDYLQET